MGRMRCINGLETHGMLAPETPACVSIGEILFAGRKSEITEKDIARAREESEEEGVGGEERISCGELTAMMIETFRTRRVRRIQTD